eukprot:Blabericola_migrator_1__3526@NODE_2046_length_3372_cov_29_044478_g1298_i0_p1_GENE_NODE_2046_length_3372_cov_29_044478_g1298_i0NODE_2046_length_3372_cov_29_044478_g1298_i0_p1_ORF_typecomplete_len819_score106_01C2/PF00168_30/7_2e03C2/PF00168_30/0_00025_NODE_2046_length_3372_cov_29_044478_g1298_i02622457
MPGPSNLPTTSSSVASSRFGTPSHSVKQVTTTEEMRSAERRALKSLLEEQKQELRQLKQILMSSAPSSPMQTSSTPQRSILRKPAPIRTASSSIYPVTTPQISSPPTLQVDTQRFQGFGSWMSTSPFAPTPPSVIVQATPRRNELSISRDDMPPLISDAAADSSSVDVTPENVANGLLEIGVGELDGVVSVLQSKPRTSVSFIQVRLVLCPPLPDDPKFDPILQTWPLDGSPQYTTDKTPIVKRWANPIAYHTVLKLDILSLRKEDRPRVWLLLTLMERTLRLKITNTTAPSSTPNKTVCVPLGQVAIPVMRILEPSQRQSLNKRHVLSPCVYWDTQRARAIVNDNRMATVDLTFRFTPYGHAEVGRIMRLRAEIDTKPPTTRRACRTSCRSKPEKKVSSPLKPASPAVLNRDVPLIPARVVTDESNDTPMALSQHKHHYHCIFCQHPLGSKAACTAGLNDNCHLCDARFEEHRLKAELKALPSLRDSGSLQVGTMPLQPSPSESIQSRRPHSDLGRVYTPNGRSGNRGAHFSPSVRSSSPEARSTPERDRLGVRDLSPPTRLTTVQHEVDDIPEGTVAVVKFPILEVAGLSYSDGVSKSDPFLRVEIKKNCPPHIDRRLVVQGCWKETEVRPNCLAATWSSQESPLTLLIPETELARLDVSSPEELLIAITCLDKNLMSGTSSVVGTYSFPLRDVMQMTFPKTVNLHRAESVRGKRKDQPQLTLMAEVTL